MTDPVEAHRVRESVNEPDELEIFDHLTGQKVARGHAVVLFVPEVGHVTPIMFMSRWVAASYKTGPQS